MNSFIKKMSAQIQKCLSNVETNCFESAVFTATAVNSVPNISDKERKILFENSTKLFERSCEKGKFDEACLIAGATHYPTDKSNSSSTFVEAVKWF